MLWLFVCFNKSHHITWELCVEYITTGVGLETPQVWAWRPPRCGPGDSLGVGLETSPWPDTSTSSHGYGPRDSPLARPLNFPPWCGPGDPPGDLQGMLGYHHPSPPRRPAARHAGIPPPSCGQTDTCKNITFANFVCRR